MLELGRKHKRGKKTFTYLYFRHGWLFTLIGLGFIYLSWLTSFGSLNDPLQNFLAGHQDWYITSTMVSEWILFLGLGIVILVYLHISIMYRSYKFILDKYAVHLHRGLFFIRETTIPYQQISNVHIERPYNYRMFGVAKLDIVTAADKEADATDGKTKKFLVPIIDLYIARTLSRQLLENASKKRRGQKINTETKDDSDDQDEDEDEFEDDDSDDDTDEEETDES